jgi:BASS family bile acid:Na+ symporter
LSSGQIPADIDQIRIQFDSEALWMLNLALGLVMFGIALDIRLSDFRQLIRAPRPLMVGIGSQFLLLPALTFVLVNFFDPLPSFALGMILVACCPGGNVSNFMTHLGGGNTALSISLTAFATLFAVLLTPLNLQFWGGLYEPSATLLQAVRIDILEMVKLVGLLLGIPLIAGMAVQHWYPGPAAYMAKRFKYGSLLFFIGLIALALYNNRAVFWDYVGLVFIVVLVHNAIALGSGNLLARLFRLEATAIKTITLETGIQNSGLGLLLIFTFFDGMGGMALIAAFWGIWHLVSGMLLAGYWAWKPRKKSTAIQDG